MNHPTMHATLGGLGIALFLGAPALAADDAHPGMFRYPDVSDKEIVFVYANDLWVVDRDGGAARPLASPPGQETFPKFSADGGTVAFIGNYEGDRDLYTVSATGGIPERVTHHPGNERLNDFTNDGRLLFSYNALSGNPSQQRLFTVPPEGGLPEALPVPYGAVGTISDDGQWLAYTTDSRDFRTWKRYRGGLATDIWLYNLKSNEARKLTEWEGTDTSPMWHDGKVYYLSDQGESGKLNLWSVDQDGGNRKQLTEYADFDVKFPSIGPGPRGRGEIVFQHGSGIKLLDLRSNKVKDVEITIPGARESLRPKRVDASEQLAGGGISSTGKRAVVEARGDIFTVPAEHGPVRQLTNTSGAAERTPGWSPDGRWIAYFSDADGEYELYITQSDGKGETRQLTDGNKTYWMNLVWSPDSETIAIVDKAGEMHLVDVESGDSKKFDRDPWGTQPPLSWSHDSRWIAYAINESNSLNSSVYLYDTESGERHKVTSGFFSDSDPTFSRTGDYLYYQSNRNFSSPRYDDLGSTFVYDQTGRIIAVPLNDTVENKQLIESDEETWEEKKDDAEEKGEDASDDGAEEASDNDADAGSDEADTETPAYLEGYNPDHALWGKWDGTAKGFSALGMPEDSVSISLIIIVDEDGTISGKSEAMGEEDDLGDTVTWNAETNEYVSESVENGMTIVQRGTVDGDTMSGTWTLKELGVGGTWEVKRSSRDISEEELTEIAGDQKEASETVEIDLDGFEARSIELDIEAGTFSTLGSNDKGNLLYLRTSGGAPSLKIFDITADEPGEKTVLPICMGYDVSGDGKKLAAATPVGYAIVDTKAGQTAKPISIDLPKTVELKEEWRQLVTDAWRRHRDFFYVENMHGVDWDGVLEHYLPMVDDAVSREDVSYIIGEMIGELNVGHAYYWGGDVDGEPSENVGLLGVDYSVAQATDDDGNTVDGFRIDTIHEGAPWDSDARNPLRAQGIDIREGDVLTHVNGVAVDTEKDPWAMFIGTAGKETSLTFIVDRPEDDSKKEDDKKDDEEASNERTVVIKPMGSETNLRFRGWVEHNRQYVEDASDGKIGYIYVPNTGVEGQNELFRQFYGQIGKEALLIDERWNGGGQIPNRFIELLNRPRTNYWYRRDGKDWPWPYASHQGPKAMLINGNAGSGGDMFPWLFKHHGIGKLIGTRTWGGLVGISGVPPLIDGGYTAVPNFGFYETDGTWGIEGHGVDPDIEVIADPSKMTDGRDPQLDAGVEHLLAEIERNPYTPPARPAEPVRTGIGIDEADK